MSFTLAPGTRLPDGRPLTARDVIDRWERRLGTPGSAARWLLAPVRGVDRFVNGETASVEGLSADGQQLEMVFDRHVPDLFERLAHPDLDVWRAPPEIPRHPSAALLPVDSLLLGHETPSHEPDPRPYLDTLILVGSAGERADTWLRIGEADMAIVHGLDVRRIAGDGGELVAQRLPDWDRTYLLWADRGARRVKDTLGHWLDRRIDRDALARYLFPGGATPATSLFAGEGPPVGATGPLDVEPPKPHVPPHRPLTLLYDADDPDAARIAGRIRASLLASKIVVDLYPARSFEYCAAAATGEIPLVLIAHRPATADPLLALRETLTPLGRAGADIIESIDSATETAPVERVERALLLEDYLIESGRFLPLVRVHAWMVHRRGLVVAPSVAWGRLSLRDAGWLR